MPAGLQRQQRVDIGGILRRRRSWRRILTKLWNFVVLRDKVGLGVDLDHDADLVVVVDNRVRQRPRPQCGRPSWRRRPGPSHAGISTAFSISPSASVRAFLQSIMPQPVFSRRACYVFCSKCHCCIPPYSVSVLVPEKCPAITCRRAFRLSRFQFVASRRPLPRRLPRAPARPGGPRCTASAMVAAISLTARIASSLPGIT